MQFFSRLFSCLLLGTLLSAGGAEPPTGAAGVWKWTMPGPNGDPIQSVLVLKVNGDKLSGSVSGRGGTESPIQDATIQGNTVSFKAVRERNGTKFATRYSGQLAGD